MTKNLDDATRNMLRRAADLIEEARRRERKISLFVDDLQAMRAMADNKSTNSVRQKSAMLMAACTILADHVRRLSTIPEEDDYEDDICLAFDEAKLAFKILGLPNELGELFHDAAVILVPPES